MKYSNIFVGLGVMTAMAVTTTAHAFDSYISLDIAHNDGSIETKKLKKNHFDIDESGLSYGVTLGVTVTDNIAVEAFYSKLESDAGSIKNDPFDMTIKQQSYGGSVSYRLPVRNNFYGIGTVGLKRIDANSTVYSDDMVKLKLDDDTSFKTFFGLGIGFQVNDRLNMELKGSKFQDMTSVGTSIVYRF